MNLHTLPRTFYLTRHGQSDYNLLGKIGGDSSLTPSGLEYARRLAVFAKDHIAKEGRVDEQGNPIPPIPCRLWTSTLRRTKETAQFIEHTTLQHTWDNGDTAEWIQFRPMAKRNLDELYAGVCDGMTYEEIEKVFPEEFKRRQSDKLAYRYPRGMFSDVLCSPVQNVSFLGGEGFSRDRHKERNDDSTMFVWEREIYIIAFFCCCRYCC